jgi:hypothetical protein
MLSRRSRKVARVAEQAGSTEDWRTQVAASWFDLRTWLAERQRLLREPTLALAKPGTLAFGPVRFALLIWVIWPAVVTSAIGTLAAVVSPPPPSLLEVRHAGAQALEQEAIAALAPFADRDEESNNAGAAELRDLHRELLTGLRSEADIAPARARYRAALERYASEGAPRAKQVLRTATGLRKLDEIPARLLRAGLQPAFGTLLSGLVLLLTARSFRRRLRKSPMAHAASAERAYLYLLPASTLWLTVLGVGAGITLALADQVPLVAETLAPIVAALILPLAWFVYWRRAPMIAGVLSGAEAPARADVRAVRIAIVASSLVAIVQICVLLFVGFMSIMFLGLLLP